MDKEVFYCNKSLSRQKLEQVPWSVARRGADNQAHKGAYLNSSRTSRYWVARIEWSHYAYNDWPGKNRSRTGYFNEVIRHDRVTLRRRASRDVHVSGGGGRVEQEREELILNCPLRGGGGKPPFRTFRLCPSSWTGGRNRYTLQLDPRCKKSPWHLQELVAATSTEWRTYEVTSWSGCSLLNFIRMFILEKRAVRTIAKLQWIVSCRPEFKNLKLSTLENSTLPLYFGDVSLF